ncbi:MAG TPA: hypothetical protein VGB97_01170 [Candidatus Paceibacterota bacterium]|jgi:hypothetical protein
MIVGLIIVLLIGGVLVANTFNWLGSSDADNAVAATEAAAAEEAAPVKAQPEPTAAAAPAPPPAPVKPMPAATPDTDTDVAVIVNFLKANKPDHNGGDITRVVKGASGKLYELTYTGDQLEPNDRALSVTDMPKAVEALDPTSDVNKTSGTMWDIGLDGDVDQAIGGSRYAPVPFRLRFAYQDYPGDENDVGVDHYPAWARQYREALKDIRAAITAPPVPKAK